MKSSKAPSEDPETKARREREEARVTAAGLRATQMRLTTDTALRRRLYGEAAAMFPGGSVGGPNPNAAPASSGNTIRTKILQLAAPLFGGAARAALMSAK